LPQRAANPAWVHDRDAIGVPLAWRSASTSGVRDFFMLSCGSCRPFRRSPGFRCRSCCGRTNEASIVFITFLGAFFPILLNSIHGFIGWTACCYGRRAASAPARYAVHECNPAGLLPHIFTGLGVGMGVAWVSLIAAG